ncbi:helix-turn-helix transcriptional regulator [Catenovulum sediminis]|uniref:Helix-turn-helix transcriptional regulator n=1 Tax=Catenovulum sediminis TaxID=1740262 RepID=A0ABV1RHN4_9ALTE
MQSADIIQLGQRCVEHYLADNEFTAFKSWQINMGGLSLLDGDYHVSRILQQHLIVLTVKGRGVWHADEPILEHINVGDILYVPAGSQFNYTACALHGWQTVWFILPTGGFWQTFPEHIKLIPASKLRYQDLALQCTQILQNMLQERFSDDPLTQQMHQTYAQQLFILLKRQLQQLNGAVDLNVKRIQSLFRKIALHPEEKWTVERMCQQCNYSRAHLFRLCQQTFACSPLQKLTKIRMQKAQLLLKTTQLPIQQIADSVGYDNAFNFSTRFKQSMNISPSQYRILASEIS